MSSFLILLFLTDRSDKKEQLFLAEMKLKNSASNQPIPGWDFSRTWYFNDIQVPLLKAKEKSKAELSVLCLTYQTVLEGERFFFFLKSVTDLIFLK